MKASHKRRTSSSTTTEPVIRRVNRAMKSTISNPIQPATPLPTKHRQPSTMQESSSCIPSPAQSDELFQITNVKEVSNSDNERKQVQQKNTVNRSSRRKRHPTARPTAPTRHSHETQPRLAKPCRSERALSEGSERGRKDFLKPEPWYQITTSLMRACAAKRLGRYFLPCVRESPPGVIHERMKGILAAE